MTTKACIHTAVLQISKYIIHNDNTHCKGCEQFAAILVRVHSQYRNRLPHHKNILHIVLFGLPRALYPG